MNTSHKRSSPGQSARNSAAAGYVAGLAGVILGHPLDSAKVWLQTNTVNQNKHVTTLSTVTATTVSTGCSLPNTSSNTSPGMMRSGLGQSSSARLFSSAAAVPLEQAPAPAPAPARVSWKASARLLRASYSGVGAPLLTVGLIQSASFTAYDGLRRVLYQLDYPNEVGSTEHSMDHLQNDSLSNVALAGFGSGSALAFLTAPLVQVKTRQQITGNGFRQTLLESLRFSQGGKTIRIPTCFVGFGPHFLMESLGRAIYYSTYEGCKRGLASLKEGNNKAVISLQERILSAGFSGILCGAVIFPLDSLRSRIYSQVTSTNSKTTMEMMRTMYQENGLRGYYRGFSITILRSGPISAVVLPIYDLVLDSMAQPV